MNVSPSASGDVKLDNNTLTSYPVSFNFLLGTTVRLEAVSAPGYEFVNWSGSLISNNNPEYITMNCSKSVTANFAPQTEPNQTASISDLAWEDTNADGIQDANELGINNVTVNLYSFDGNLVGSTTTSDGGLYNFSGLQPGQYYLEFVAHEGYTFSPKNHGEDDMIDSDTGPNGQTDILTLAAGENDTTQDAGLYWPEIASYEISLVSGWNLISLPTIPESPDINDILAGITYNIESVWFHDASIGDWRNYTPGAPPDLTQVTHATGYWVKVTDPCILTGRGRKPTLPTDISLFSSWSLIGLPFIAVPQLIEDISNDVTENFITAWSYDAAAGEWHNYTPGAPPDLTHVTNKRGYWFRVINQCTLTIERIAINITPVEVYTLIQDYQENTDFMILDVRTPDEYENGHIEEAVNLDYYSASFVDEVSRLNKNRTYIV